MQAATTNPEEVRESYFQNYHIVIYKMSGFQKYYACKETKYGPGKKKE